MRVTPINPYAKLLRERKYKPKIIKNKKKYDRKIENDRLPKDHERD
jgi:hypothetical protein